MKRRKPKAVAVPVEQAFMIALAADDLCTIDESLDRRAAGLRTAASRCAGSLYPGIYQRQAAECDDLRNRIMQQADTQLGKMVQS